MLLWSVIAQGQANLSCIVAVLGQDTEVKVVDFKAGDRASFKKFYEKELQNRKFHEVRDGFLNSEQEKIKLGSQELHWFLQERYGEQIKAIPKEDSKARAKLFREMIKVELSESDKKKNLTEELEELREINLQKMHEVPLASANASYGERVGVMRRKLDKAQFGREVTFSERNSLPKEEDRPFTEAELELALRSGIAGDLENRQRERERRREGDTPQSIIREWIALRRSGQIEIRSETDIHRLVTPQQAATDPGAERVITPQAAEARRIFRAALLVDSKEAITDSFPYLIRDLAIENGFRAEEVAEHHPRAMQLVTLVEKDKPHCRPAEFHKYVPS